ncbi:hypothetical protein [Kitasatospora sp. NPDC006786]|uniref:hypothetical protein n=1 Tax=unclassified Kitasatospora TaxID=2633591 RepID=UPI0033DEB2E2
MDIVYASLRRKGAAGWARAGEAEEVQAALWAHTRPADAVQHITVRCEPEQVDLLLYLLTHPAAAETATENPAAPAPSEAAAKDSLAIAYSLITRSHQASPMLRRRYQPPIPPTAR